MITQRKDKVNQDKITRVQLPRIIVHKVTRVGIRLHRVNLTWVDINTYGKYTLCRSTLDKFKQGMIN